MHEKGAVLRSLRFRTIRPAFDGALRSVVLPALRAQEGVQAVWAGRQGPDEIGPRVLVSVWSSYEAMEVAVGSGRAGQEAGEQAEIVDAVVSTHPVATCRLGLRRLGVGVLRLAEGRASGAGRSALAELVLQDIAGSQARNEGPGDVVVAGAEAGDFVVISTWPDWRAIEAATGRSMSDPLRNKRSAGLEDFHADHYELVGGNSPET